jgi:signal transduction histidine kinase
MVGTPSPEFIALCQSQLLVLTQALGAISAVVYIADAAADPANPALVPVAAYPENADRWGGLRQGLTLAPSSPADAWLGGETPLQGWPGRSAALGSGFAGTGSAMSGELLPVERAVDAVAAGAGREPEAAFPLVLPLAHDGVVLGMIVSTRDAEPWSSEDCRRAEQVANTLAIACLLDQRNQWLQRQLTQRQLTQADQSETFHDLLHQFRNPLTALQTFGRLMVKRLPSDDTNRPIAEGIVRESRRLQDLAQHFDEAVTIADEALVQASSPAAGGLLLPAAQGDRRGEPGETRAIAPAGHGLGRSLSLEPATIPPIALPLVQSIRPLAEERGLRLIHQIPAQLPQVWLDRAALGEVLHNLLDNALKYATPGALVWVTAGLEQSVDGQLFQGIAVGDTGPGIPTADQARLFTRYFRGIQAEGSIPGTGLGLAIVRDLVQGMGGYIDVVSPVQGTPWLPPAAAGAASSGATFGPGAVFIVWLRAGSGGALPGAQA